MAAQGRCIYTPLGRGAALRPHTRRTLRPDIAGMSDHHFLHRFIRSANRNTTFILLAIYPYCDIQYFNIIFQYYSQGRMNINFFTF